MENREHQRVLNIAYIVVAALVAFITLTGLMKLSSTFDLEAKVTWIEYFFRGLSIFLGAAVFLVLYRNAVINAYMQEVASELLTKVVWPTRKETTSATVIVIITVCIAGVGLGVFDWLWALILKWIIT